MVKTIYMTVADYWRTKEAEILAGYEYPKAIRTLIVRWMLPVLGMQRISEVTLTDMQRMIRRMQENGASPHTQKKLKGALRKLFYQAERERLIRENPVDQMEGISVTEQRIAALPPGEEIGLIRAFRETKHPELYLLQMVTGTAFKELAACRVEDFSEEEGTLRILRTVTGRGIRNLPGGRARTLKLSAMEVRLLKQAMKRGNVTPEMKGALIFTGQDGHLMLRAPRKEIDAIRRHSGLSDFSADRSRHWFIARAMSLGVNPRALNQYTGYAPGGYFLCLTEPPEADDPQGSIGNG